MPAVKGGEKRSQRVTVRGQGDLAFVSCRERVQWSWAAHAGQGQHAGASPPESGWNVYRRRYFKFKLFERDNTQVGRHHPLHHSPSSRSTPMLQRCPPQTSSILSWHCQTYTAWRRRHGPPAPALRAPAAGAGPGEPGGRTGAAPPPLPFNPYADIVRGKRFVCLPECGKCCTGAGGPARPPVRTAPLCGREPASARLVLTTCWPASWCRSVPPPQAGAGLARACTHNSSSPPHLPQACCL